MLSRCFLDFSVGVGAFVIGLSQISSFSLRLPLHGILHFATDSVARPCTSVFLISILKICKLCQND